ncbi:MAG TPA: bifunctional riboflavin kinase/FAD synthetase [Chloroflexia bacterium]|nr:bifunctional riboflavin kinase/FAD synthetase [Chloroflexia bacterium]
MQTIRDIEAYRSAPTVLTIGNFDGVHLGHQQLLGTVRDRARALAAVSTVATFDPHTRAVVRPDQPLELLTQLPEKLEGFAAVGLDQAAVVPFTTEMTRLGAREFLAWLGASFPLVELWAGQDFALGHHRTGNLDVLTALGQEMGFAVRVFPPVQEGSTIISSTAIRTALAAGAVDQAAAMLGRLYTLPGVVVSGARRGRELGFPTANLDPPPHQALPADGIYATWTVRPRTGGRHASITSIGVRPTFGPSERLVEVYILDFSDDLYGEQLCVEFVAHLRPQVAYTGPEPLIAQMHQDLARTRAILAGAATT